MITMQLLASPLSDNEQLQFNLPEMQQVANGIGRDLNEHNLAFATGTALPGTSTAA